jgi:high affinity Mn2+ porin
MTRVKSICLKICYEMLLPKYRRRAGDLLPSLAASNRPRAVSQPTDAHRLVSQIIPILNWRNSKPKALTGSVVHGPCSQNFAGTIVRKRINHILLGCSSVATICLLLMTDGRAADIADANAVPVMPLKAPPIANTNYDWSGFYVGGHLGYAWGNSNWAASGADGSAAGSLNFSQGINPFTEAGSWNEGVQFGYNAMLKNRFVFGVEADLTFPAYQNLAGISTGNATTYAGGNNSYTDTLLASGTVRARIGYAPGNWLFYATGGLAWTVDQFTLAQQTTGISAVAQQPRVGWAAGAGVEFPITGHWTGKLEYLYTQYGSTSVNFAPLADQINSNLSLQEIRLGLNYQFGNPASSNGNSAAPSFPDLDNFSFHGQATFTDQAYPAFHSAIPDGAQSLPQGGQNAETFDLTLYAGMKLWKGAELWVDPELDQGFGVGNAHGLAGFASAESYKLGWAEPYARIQRYFIRQTIDLGGDTQKVDADINAFDSTTTSDRLVLTLGKFQVVDLFDTNKYANNAKTDFLNWTSVNVGSLDYAGDAWAYTYGAAAEWYTGRYTFRAGVFDMSQTPASTASYGVLGAGSDSSFSNLEFIGEIEERHELWGQPGKLKLTGYVISGQQGNFAQATALFNQFGANTPTPINAGDTAADYWMNASRSYQNVPGISFNLEQQVNDNVGVFARAGWVNGQYEMWDNTDVGYSGQVGVSIKGTQWGRPDDTVGIDGVVNGITNAEATWLNDGGLGILIGDGPGSLTQHGLEKIMEAYYSYAVSAAVKVSVDYQFIDNPAYNTQRGPVNLFAGRVRWQF